MENIIWRAIKAFDEQLNNVVSLPEGKDRPLQKNSKDPVVSFGK